MDKFRVGQKVRIINALELTQYIGIVCTITTPKQFHIHAGNFQEYAIYGVDLPPFQGCRVGFPEDYLEPVYDGYEASNWSECAWKPKSKVESA